MADKEKRISIASFDKVLKEQAVPNTTEHWFGNEVVIKHTISIAQMLAFVDNVVSSCFHDEGYMPEVKDLLIKSNLLTRYANFTLPENLEHRYTLIYNTDAVAMVSKHISISMVKKRLYASFPSNHMMPALKSFSSFHKRSFPESTILHIATLERATKKPITILRFPRRGLPYSKIRSVPMAASHVTIATMNSKTSNSFSPAV